MKSDSVSVIIPAYNCESSLRSCLESVFSQELLPEQVFVINDGSTDSTAEIVKDYFNRIIYLEQENQGQGAARNKGLVLSRGEFVAFLDADDYWLKGFLKSCVQFLKNNKDIIAVSTGLIIKSENGKQHIHSSFNSIQKAFQKPIIIDNFFQFWADYDHVRTGSTVIRKSIVDKAGLQREDLRISQDLEYWGYIATFGKWGFIPEPLWVGNSRLIAKRSWLEKYKKRRSLCPSVEAWEKRIVQRLKDEDISGFEIVRGRVAAYYAHNKILAGRYDEAYEIIKNYGRTMPKNKLTMIFKVGTIFGNYSWKLVCIIVLLKEKLKAIKLLITKEKFNE
jgi:glycosyltransferase involved in cell wall biosynthesis